MKGIRKFSRNTLLYLSSNVIGAALPFLLLPFLIRELGAQQYGKIGLVTSAFTLLLTVVGMGTHAFVRTSYSQCSEQELKEILGNAVFVLATTCSVALLLTVGAGFIISLPLPVTYLVIAALAAFGQKVINIKLVLWQMSGRPAAYGALTILMTLLNLGLSIALVFVANLQAEGRILGIWLPAIAVGPVILLLMYRGSAINFRFSPAIIRKILRFGLPLIPHGFALTLIVFVERAVLSANPDETALGVFFAAFQLSLPIGILVNSVNLQFRAWSDRMMVAGKHGAVVAGSYLIMAGFLMAALFYAFILQYLYAGIVGQEMASGYNIAVILIFAAMFRGFYLVVAKALFFSRNTVLLMNLSVCLSLMFSVVLLFFNSLYTVAYLNLAFNALLFISVWIASARVYPQPWLSLPDWNLITHLRR